MRELNTSEKKVLTLLEQDCRLSASKIAKNVLISSEGVLKIIKRLKEKKVISKFNVKINYSKMGYRLYPVHIKLSKRNSEIIEEIKRLLKQCMSVAWFHFCEGEYDLLISFRVLYEKDKGEMDALLSNLSEYINEKETSIVLTAFEFSKSFLETKQKAQFKTMDYTVDKAELLELDFKIIELLRSNSRETVLNIAKKLETTPRIILLRMKKMRKIGVIEGFKTRLNMANLGYQPCFALIEFGKFSERDHSKFKSYCQHTEGIHYYLRQIGKYGLEITFDVKSTNEFYDLIDNLREKFPTIKKITTLISKDS